MFKLSLGPAGALGEAEPSASAEGGLRDGRCVCGSLLVRLGTDHAVLKCRRCKRITTVPAVRQGGADADVRCTCGCLLARVLAGELELKCRRCKQTTAVLGPFDASASRPD